MESLKRPFRIPRSTLGQAGEAGFGVYLSGAAKDAIAQWELCKKSKLALGTIQRMENFVGPVATRAETLGRAVNVLEKAGVEFLNNDRPGMRVSALHTRGDHEEHGEDIRTPCSRCPSVVSS